MSSFVSLLGLFALAPALLLTLFLVQATQGFTMRAPSGPDAMGLISLFAFPALAWLATLGAALAAAGRGSFDWISRVAGVPSLVVAATVVGLGVLSLFATGVSMEVRFGARTLIGLAGGLALPLVTQAYLLAMLLLDPASLALRAWTRATGSVLALLAAVTYAGWAVVGMRSMAAQAEREAVSRVESAKRDQQEVARDVQRTVEQNAALDAMPDDAPLPEFLSHLFIDKTEAHNAYAAMRISRLPHLTERLAERLADPAPIQREYAANFIRMCESVDPAWAPAVRKAILLLAEDYRLETRDPSRGKITHVKGLTKGILLTARRFEGERFTAEVSDLRAALRAFSPSEEREEAEKLADAYLAGEVIR